MLHHFHTLPVLWDTLMVLLAEVSCFHAVHVPAQWRCCTIYYHYYHLHYYFYWDEVGVSCFAAPMLHVEPFTHKGRLRVVDRPVHFVLRLRQVHHGCCHWLSSLTTNYTHNTTSTLVPSALASLHRESQQFTYTDVVQRWLGPITIITAASGVVEAVGLFNQTQFVLRLISNPFMC